MRDEKRKGDVDPALMRSFMGHKDKVTQVIFNPNMKQCVSCSTDGMIMTWGLRPNSRPQKFVGHKVTSHFHLKGSVYDIDVNPAGNQIASCSRDNTIRVWTN